MQLRRGCSVAGLMGFVALIAVGLGAFRIHPSLGSFVMGLILLTSLRYRGIARACETMGRPLLRRDSVWACVESFFISLAILGIATMIALTIFLFGNELEGGRSSHGPAYDSPISLFLAVSAAWYIARRGRRDLWPSRRCNVPANPSSRSPEIEWLPGLELVSPAGEVSETPSASIE